jgi:hypothetical protein
MLRVVAGARSGAAGRFGPHPGDMTRYELPGYTLIAIDNSQLRRDMAKLPKLTRAMELSLGVTRKPTGIPTRVWVVSSSVWDRYLEPSPGIVSEFIPTRFANYIVANGALVNRQMLFHEHAHLFLHTQAPGFMPLWFDEGLAELMERAEFTENTVRFFPSRRTQAGGWISTAQVLRATKSSPEYLNTGQTGLFHSQARAMVHRALVDEPEFGRQVFAYLDAVNNLQPVEEASRAFGVDLHDLDFQMRAYVDKSVKHYAKMPLGSIRPQPLPKGTPVSRLDSLLGLATVMLDTGLGLERLDEVLDAADRLPEGNAQTRVLRLRLAALRMDDVQIEHLLKVVDADLDDPAIARGAGLALFERTLTLGEHPAPAERAGFYMTRAFELLDRALRAHADDPEATFAFATLAAGLRREIDLALTRLAPMFERLPRNPDMASAAARLLDIRGDESTATFLTAVLRYSCSLEQKAWAAQRMAQLSPPAPSDQTAR